MRAVMTSVEVGFTQTGSGPRVLVTIYTDKENQASSFIGAIEAKALAAMLVAAACVVENAEGVTLEFP